MSQKSWISHLSHQRRVAGDARLAAGSTGGDLRKRLIQYIGNPQSKRQTHAHKGKREMHMGGNKESRRGGPWHDSFIYTSWLWHFGIYVRQQTRQVRCIKFEIRDFLCARQHFILCIHRLMFCCVMEKFVRAAASVCCCCDGFCCSG